MTLSPMQFAYDNSPALERVRAMHGSRDVGQIFGEHHTTAGAPWPAAARRKDRDRYDRSVVHEALSKAPEVEEFDPRHLHATQPKITRAGVAYYMGDQYGQTGRTFADHDQTGNRWPFVYQREDGQNLVLSGHHRATAALLRGEPLRARSARGPWGPAYGAQR